MQLYYRSQREFRKHIASSEFSSVFPLSCYLTRYTFCSTKLPSYKDSFNYSDYAKVNGKWIKTTKSATIYVPSKYVKGYTNFVWQKYTKKATGYFWTPVNNGITLAEYNQVKSGMTYNQVLSLTGQNLTMTYSSEYDGWTSKSYEWKYEKMTETAYDLRYVMLDFEDGKLTYKSQFGLK